ncbi:hypothetical protein A200_07609 [Parascardovia denticolens IPLA 20019]|uniref:ImmA/IrrE family metallo-endopeptidase n=1 Tax=Parascardovia denticolens TaxID=78258 RepID=UPI0002669870|nr:ImmA/IrrE family metallo-endopeptidase [Parascardovia denticolens]EIT87650.1 hypothetical protein A200_07609 [Parascardovia denticolens IPLA 20019]
MLVWDAANKRAQDILDAYWDGKTFPIPLDEIIKQIGLTYKRTVLPGDLSGIIVKDENSFTPRIFIDSTEGPQRQRFTLAHEIGHFVERKDANDADYSFVEKRRLNAKDYDLHEFYADEFAGALLMPKESFSADEKHHMSDDELAEKYGVSKAVAHHRRKRLQRIQESIEAMSA